MSSLRYSEGYTVMRKYGLEPREESREPEMKIWEFSYKYDFEAQVKKREPNSDAGAALLC